MAWSMHTERHYDRARLRWLAPPPVTDDAVAAIDAPTARDLLRARCADSSDHR